MQTTVGRLAIDEILPKGFLKDFPQDKPLGNRDIEHLLQRVAEEQPDKYRDISHKLLRLGAKASVETGSSFSLSDLDWPVPKASIMDKVDKEERKIFFDPRLDQKQKEDQLVLLYGRNSAAMPDISFDSGISKGSNLAKMVASGARGNKSQLNSNVGADFLVVDQNHKPVPLGIKHSFSEGLSLPEYFAGGYGARSGTIDGKFAVRDAGFLCLSGDTLVLMADYSEKKIKDIEVGDVVFGSDTSGNIRPVSVLNKFANGIRQVNRYAFRLGKSRSDVVIVDATPYHKVLSKRVAGRKINNKIQVLPLSAVSKSFRCQPIQSVDYIGGRNVPLAFIVGYLTGDGGLTSHSVNFACGDNKALEYLSSVAESSGLLVKKVREREDVEYTIQDPLKPHLISTGGIAGESSEIVKLLKELDLWGKQSYQKGLHTDIFNWDTQSCTEFCAGLFEADGCATYSNNSTIPIISFCTTSEDMVRGYSELLRFRFGIHSSGVRRVPSVKTTRKLYNKILGRNTVVRSNHDGWKFVINDRESVIKFCELFSGRGRKGDTLKTLCENISEPKRQDKFVYSYLWQEDLGEIETFDIEVDHPDHLFVLANGLIVSNSKQLGSVSMDMIVTEDDCGTKNGIPVASSDKDNIGSILGRSVGGYKAGTIITPKVYKDIQDSKIDQIVLRSPITCEAKNGGICAHCAGIREKNKLPSIGENVGLSAASSFSEPLCLAAGTLVRMGDFSTKKIEEIQVGDMVLGYGADGLTRPTLVLNTFDNGIQECIETRFKKSRGKMKVFHSVVSTPCHRVLMCFPTRKDKRASAQVYPIGAIPPSHVKRLKFAGRFDDAGLEANEFDLLAGLLLGDGSYAGISTQGVFLSCYDPSLIHDINEYLGSLGVRAAPQHTDGEFRISALNFRVQIDLPDGTYVRNPVKEFLKNTGMWGFLAGDKKIPDCVTSWNNRSVARLISGLIASDGWISTPKSGNNVLIGFGSSSRKLVEGFKELLELRFGVYGCEISESYKPREEGGFYNPQYSFTVCNWDDVRMLSEVLEVPGIKGRKLKKAVDDKITQVVKESGRVSFQQCYYGFAHTHDIEISNDTHLYVLANQLVTHNSQALLRSKHAAGVSNAAGVTGFKGINAMFQVPDIYPNKATLTTKDGLVEKIEELPQGGSHVFVGGVAHYVPPTTPITVKQGDTLEAGDPISEGNSNPSEVTALKGIGQGRLSFIKDVKSIFADNGVNINRRNAEVVAKAAIDHIQVNDAEDTSSYLPEDIVRYGNFVRSYNPRETSYNSAPKQAVGKYLERPALHYSIGTRITDSVAKNLEKFGDKELLVNDEEPTFEPKMIRLMDAPSYNEDWMAQLGTSYVQKNLKKNVVEGTSFSDIHGKHPLPAMAYGKEFGKPPAGTVGY